MQTSYALFFISLINHSLLEIQWGIWGLFCLGHILKPWPSVKYCCDTRIYWSLTSDEARVLLYSNPRIEAQHWYCKLLFINMQKDDAMLERNEFPDNLLRFNESSIPRFLTLCTFSHNYASCWIIIAWTNVYTRPLLRFRR